MSDRTPGSLAHLDAGLKQLLASLYAVLVVNPQTDVFSEYDANGQHLRQGRLGATVTLKPTRNAANVSPDDIEAELFDQLTARRLPYFGRDGVYMVQMPSGVSVQGQCKQFCAYHGAFKWGDDPIAYAVLVDLPNDCNCRSGGLTKADAVGRGAAHELMEIITDADAGLAKRWDPTTPDLAWYWYTGLGGSGYEVGDLCNNVSGLLLARGKTYVVQKIWSNVARACINLK